MSALGKLQAKLAELLQINEAMVTHIESLASERDYFKNGMAELQDIIDKLEPERDALRAQVEAMKIIVTVHEREMPNMINKNEGDRLYLPLSIAMNSIADAVESLPKERLRKIQAEVGRAGFVAGTECCADYLDTYYADIDFSKHADQYAERVKRGEQ